MNLMPDAADVAHLVERRRQLRVLRFSGDEHARLPPRFVQRDSARTIGDAKLKISSFA